MRRGLSPAPGRGSAVITVLVLAAVTALIVAGLLNRAVSESRFANRAFYLAAAVNLAEAGLEEAIYDLNTNAITSGGSWSLAPSSTSDYVKIVTSGLKYGQATGAIYLRVDQAASATPVITAAGVLSMPGQANVVKQIRVGGRTSSRIWANTLVARGNITLSGQADIDSYDSALGPYNPTTNRSDRATVATAAHITVSGRASIYGYVATAGGSPTVGGSGRIYGATTPGSTAIDTSRVRSDFNANLTDASAPTGAPNSLGSVAIKDSTVITLPRPGDTLGPNGRYLYSATSLSVAGSAILKINGPVDIAVAGKIEVGTSGSITVGGSSAVDPSLNLYSPGTISLNGSGIVNETGIPLKVSIWGTKPSDSSAQEITLNNSTAFYGTLYAANGNVTLSGKGGIYGAIIGRNVNIGGTADIHYDLQLTNALSPGGPVAGATASAGTLRITSWAELSAAPTSGSAFARDKRPPFSALF